jgi:hypothetical protein
MHAEASDRRPERLPSEGEREVMLPAWQVSMATALILGAILLSALLA